MQNHDVDEWEYPDPDDTSETVACGECGEAIYEDAVQCPACGQYVVRSSTSVLTGRPGWFVALAVAGIVALVFWLVRG